MANKEKEAFLIIVPEEFEGKADCIKFKPFSNKSMALNEGIKQINSFCLIAESETKEELEQEMDDI